MAFEGFLQINPIQGEATDNTHKDWIQVLEMDFGNAIPTNNPVPLAGDAALNPAHFSNVLLKLPTGKSTPRMFVACATAEIFPTATLHLVRTYGNQRVVALTIVLTQVIVAKCEVSGNSAAKTAHGFGDEVELNYDKITITHHKPGRGGGNVSKWYERSTNTHG